MEPTPSARKFPDHLELNNIDLAFSKRIMVDLYRSTLEALEKEDA